MRPRIGVVEHHPDCPPGLFGQWLLEAGADLDIRRPCAGDALPAVTGTDAVAGLVVLGGPMDAWDDDHHPWLEATQALIREAATHEVPTLGVCLGHQLCALAFGGDVGRSPRGQQVGMTSIAWQPAVAEDLLLGSVSAATAPARGVHWNDDLVLTLPSEATPLAVTEAGDLQAARFAASVWGVQWHPEVDESLVAPWAAEDADRHRKQGIDQRRVLEEIAASRTELEMTWRPLADRLVALTSAVVSPS